MESAIYMPLGHLTKITNYRYDEPRDWYGKPIRGGVFGHGGFILVVTADYSHRMPGIKYAVFHCESCFPVSLFHHLKAEALAEARFYLRNIPQERLIPFLANYAAQQRACRVTYEAKMQEFYARNQCSSEERVKPINKKRREIFETSNGECFYCKTKLELTGRWHIEHKLPRSKGGTDLADNLVASCVRCNCQKNDRTAEEFIEARGAKA